MTSTEWLSLGWLLVAALLGWAVSAIFAGKLRLSRRVFLVAYVVIAGGFTAAFVRWSGIDVSGMLRENWAWGVIAGVTASALLALNVRAQPHSQNLRGAALTFDLGWLGVVYGTVDALFLNVMPVLAAWKAFASLGWPESWVGTLAAGAVWLAASQLVTATYHLGYPEFRNRKLGLVLAGNGVITLAYLISGNPLGAIISHVAMHLAAVRQGPETTLQLPPHYRKPTASGVV